MLTVDGNFVDFTLSLREHGGKRVRSLGRQCCVTRLLVSLVRSHQMADLQLGH
jgi:hypothetical protein